MASAWGQEVSGGSFPRPGPGYENTEYAARPGVTRSDIAWALETATKDAKSEPRAKKIPAA